MASSGPLHAALGSLVRAFEGIDAPYMIIGGIAVLDRPELEWSWKSLFWRRRDRGR